MNGLLKWCKSKDFESLKCKPYEKMRCIKKIISYRVSFSEKKC